MHVEDNILQNEILVKLKSILDMDNSKWKDYDINIKIKIIHHYCNFLNKNSNINYNIINIPLKSIKPKKLIQFTNINKTNNNNIFLKYCSLILNFTFQYRNNYLNKSKKKYYILSNLPKNEYNNILFEYNKIVYDFIINNKNIINIKTLYNNLIGNNYDKLIIKNNPTSLNINIINNKLELVFDNNITIECELIFVSDKITNNIPVKYYIKLLNKF
jgi:hypothetical protein